jgi:hypothetical protein
MVFISRDCAREQWRWWIQHVAECQPSPVDTRTDSRDAGVRDGSNFLITEAADFAQEKGFAVIGWQTFECLSEAGACGLRSHGYWMEATIEDWRARVAPPAVQHDITGDLEHPRTFAFPMFVLIAASDNAEKDFLRQVVGCSRVASDPPEIALDDRCVLLEEPAGEGHSARGVAHICL